MDYAKLEKFVSTPRLDRYLVSCDNSHERAMKLYEANLIVCQAFYPILNLFETFLRNAINDKLALHFRDTACLRDYVNMLDEIDGKIAHALTI